MLSKAGHDFEFDPLIYSHDNIDPFTLVQLFFTFCVVLTNFLNPKKMATSSGKALTLTTSPKKCSEC